MQMFEFVGVSPLPSRTSNHEALRDYSIFTGFWYGSCGAFVI
jgi:hypothetical protein